MQLKTVQVTEYKSIRDTGPFEIGNVTCLVGKNEAGKTTVLEAIYKLNPIIPEHGKFNVTDDYPRADVEDYTQAIEAKKRKHANVITATYELEEDEFTAIENDFGIGVIPSRTVILKRGYANSTTISCTTDEAVAVQHLIKEIELPPEVRAIAATKITLKELLGYLSNVTEEQGKTHKAALAEANKHVDASEKAQAIDAANKLQESETTKQLRTALTEITEAGLSKILWDTYLIENWPKFLYFDEYYQMEGQVNVQALQQRQTEGKLTESDRPMLGLIDLARLKIDQLLAAQDTQALLNKIEGASNHLSKQILKYWSQNKHIMVRFDLRPALPQDPEGMRTGTNLWGFVHDTKHLATTRLGTRSRGFIWFFSFLAWFSQQKKLNKPLILLLDEPGLFLHANAQADLLRYIEAELRPHHQVIYTTHSPFMIEPADFSRVRIVRDKSTEQDDDLPEEQQGTKVFTDVLEADEGSLFPLQGALGYDIAQTLFIGPNSLIVEGVSDLLFIQTMSAILQAAGREGLKADWTITPVGGSDRVPTFVALLGAQKKIKIATLIDFQMKDQQKIENLFRKKLLKKKDVNTFADFTGTTEADIEDMFDPTVYLAILNAEYNAELSSPIKLGDLPQGSPRILVRIENYLTDHPLKNSHFNHFRPARYFSEHSASFSLGEPTLGRFEKAFQALNALLE